MRHAMIKLVMVVVMVGVIGLGLTVGLVLWSSSPAQASPPPDPQIKATAICHVPGTTVFTRRVSGFVTIPKGDSGTAIRLCVSGRMG